MDSRRFDAIARSAAIPATRRSALGALVAGGLLGALGLSREDPAPVAAQGQGGLCVLDFVAAVRQGPSLNRPLVAGGAPGTLRGSLRFSLSGSGDLQQADLLLADGSSLPVVGQATGHGFQARIDLGQGRAVVAVGVGEQDVSRCLGRLDGPATGPEVGDLGEWHAIAGVQNLPVGSGGSGGSGASGGARENGSRPAGAAAGGGSQPTGGGRSNASGSSGGGGKRPNGGSQSNAGGTSGEGGAGGQSGPACSQGQTRCGDACVDLQTDPVNCGRCSNACPAGAECFDGSCRPAGGNASGASSSGGSSTSAQSAQTCPSGQTRCGDACVDVQTDKAHCGQCNHPCASELGAGTCIDGVCTCAPGTTRCDNVCVNTERDPFNCGTCGTICPNDGECLGGVCEAGESDCPQGETNCSGVCVDLKTDPDNCGTCGNLCQVSPEVFNCEDGVCVPPSCDPLTDCGGLCVDLQSDPLHCGVCGTTCAQGQVCGNGTCSCPEGQILCGDSCRNGLPTADGGTVCSGGGSPPTACPPGQTLCNGACFPEGACQPADCPPGQGRCYGYCKDFMTDPGYCGSCSNACPGGICSGGACITCPAGQTPCGTACVDTRTDLANCGFCGNACGTQCLDGQCLGVGPAPTKRCALVGEACALGSDCCAGERCIFDKCYMAAEICPFGSTRCSSTKGNFCADSNNDPNFCGGCDGRCVEGAICQSGKCVAPQTLAPTVVETCPEGQDDCGSGCVDVSFDSLNCGVCFNTCAAGDTCQNGQCSTPETVDDATTLVEEEPASSCPEGQADCGGVCTDLTTDPLNCGGCFNACAAAEACQDGQCFAPAVDDTATLVEEEPPASSCPEGQVDCVGYCADILSDLYNCGGCDVICEPGNICDFGVCTVDPAAIAPEGEDPSLESAPAEGDTTCAAFGEACDPASPGACCSGVCNDDGTCA